MSRQLEKERFGSPSARARQPILSAKLNFYNKFVILKTKAEKMDKKKKIYVYIFLVIIFVGILFRTGKEWACGCGCGAPFWGLKSYLTGWVYPPIGSGLCFCPCFEKYRFPIEIIIIGLIFLLILWFLWIKKSEIKKN